mgnify:CR=1 FL=1
MQTGACDAVCTSSTSLISFHLDELSKGLTSGKGSFYWFMFEPLMISKEVFGRLPKAQQDVVMAVGAELEGFARDAAKADEKKPDEKKDEAKKFYCRVIKTCPNSPQAKDADKGLEVLGLKCDE